MLSIPTLQIYIRYSLYLDDLRHMFKVVTFFLSFKLASFEDNIEIHITLLEIAICSHRGFCYREINYGNLIIAWEIKI
jgi:hypothetical protein